MKKIDLLKRLCVLGALIAAKHFSNNVQADCFCGEKKEDITGFHFSPATLRFIEDAVKEKLERDVPFTY